MHVLDFAAELEKNVSGDATVSIVPTTGKRRGQRAALLWIGGSASLLVLAIVFAVVWMLRPRPQRMDTLHTGLCTSIVFAPDGKRMYSESGTDIFVWDVVHGIKEDIIKHGFVPEAFQDDSGSSYRHIA